jgi:hypothetical protein
MKTTGMFTLLTGPPFCPVEWAACIGRGNGIRSSSTLTSTIFMTFLAPLEFFRLNRKALPLAHRNLSFQVDKHLKKQLGFPDACPRKERHPAKAARNKG